MIIGGLGIVDLAGLENLGQFGNELSIVNNKYLVTLKELGENLPDSYRTSIRNVGIRDNPVLEDVDGLSYFDYIDGEFVSREDYL